VVVKNRELQDQNFRFFIDIKGKLMYVKLFIFRYLLRYCNVHIVAAAVLDVVDKKGNVIIPE